MHIAALFSGGKDSIYAIHIAHQWGWNITHLVTILPDNPDSFMFHTLNLQQTPLIATAMNIPLISTTTNGEKETELQELENLLRPLSIQGVINGAIASEYQRTRIEKICYNLELKSFTPLWHKNQKHLLLDQINAGYKIMIVGVFADGLDESWLGTILTKDSAQKLNQITEKYHINPAGEGGEYETMVISGPLFSQHIVIDEMQKIWKRDHGYLCIQHAHLDSHKS